MDISSVFYGATVQVGEMKDEPEHRDVCYQQVDPSISYGVFSECFHGYQVSTYLQAGLGNFTVFANVQSLLNKIDGEICSLLSIGWSCFNTTLHAIRNENHCSKESALTTMLDYPASMGVNVMKLNTTLNGCAAQPEFWRYDQSICDNEDHIIQWLLSKCLLDWDEVDLLMPILFGDSTGIEDIGCRIGHRIFECGQNIAMNNDILQYFRCKAEDVSNALNSKGYWFDNLVPGLYVTQCLHEDSEIPYKVFDITIFFPGTWNDDMKHQIMTMGEALMTQAIVYYIPGSFQVISISEIGRMKRQTSGNSSSAGFVAECEIKVASDVTVQSVTNNITAALYQLNSSNILYGVTVQVGERKDETDMTVPELDCSNIDSIVFHLNQTCKSVQYLNTDDSTTYCKHLDASLLCAKVAFNWRPYIAGKCNDSMMFMTIKANEEKFRKAFGGKNVSSCNVLYEGKVQYKHLNGSHITNIMETLGNLPCENNSIEYIAKYNCDIRQRDMSDIEWHLMMKDPCGFAAWKKSCVDETMKDWTNTTCHNVKDVLKRNSENIFGKNFTLENCTNDVCSSYGQLSVANQNWTNCMHLLVTTLMEDVNSNSGVNRNDTHLALCKLYNVSFQCVVNSTRNKGYNCSSAHLNKWAIPALTQYLGSMNTSYTRMDSSGFDANTCPANSSSGEICVLPAYFYVSNAHENPLLYRYMTGTLSLLHNIFASSFDGPSGSDTNENDTSHMPYPMGPWNASSIPANRQILVCSVYEMELGRMLAYLDKKKENCSVTNMLSSVNSAVELWFKHVGQNINPTAILDKCNGTVEKSNGSICDPRKLMLKRAALCLWYWSDSCMSFQVFKHCVLNNNTYSTDDNCTYDQKVQAWKDGDHLKNVIYPHLNVTKCEDSEDKDMPVPELDCSDIDSVVFHLNRTCKSVQYLNTDDSTTYCKHLDASLLCAKVAFNWRPYIAGKCNDSMMFMTIKANEEMFRKAFGGKTVSSCNVLYEGKVQYKHLNGSHITNIMETLGNLPCENNSIEYIAKYNCDIRQWGMSDTEWHLVMKDPCGVAAWKKSCVDATMKDWANTTCHNVKDVFKRNSENIFGTNVTLENCPSEIPFKVFDVTISFPGGWNADMEYQIMIAGEALMRQAITHYIPDSFYVRSLSEIGRRKRQTSDNSSSTAFVAECEIKVASDVTVQNVTKNITEAINNMDISSVFYGATVQVGEMKDEPEHRDVCYQQVDPSIAYGVFSECFHGYQVSTYLQAGLGNFTVFANVQNLLNKVDGEICSLLSIGWSCFNTTLHAIWNGSHCSKESALTTMLDYTASMGVNVKSLNTTFNQCTAQPEFWRYDQSICDNEDRIIRWLLSTCLLDWDEIDLLMPILFGNNTGIDDIGCRIGHHIFECAQNITMNYDIQQYFQCKVEDVLDALTLKGDWFDQLVPGLNVTKCFYQDD